MLFFHYLNGRKFLQRKICLQKTLTVLQMTYFWYVLLQILCHKRFWISDNLLRHLLDFNGLILVKCLVRLWHLLSDIHQLKTQILVFNSVTNYYPWHYRRLLFCCQKYFYYLNLWTHCFCGNDDFEKASGCSFVLLIHGKRKLQLAQILGYWIQFLIFLQSCILVVLKIPWNW